MSLHPDGEIKHKFFYMRTVFRHMFEYYRSEFKQVYGCPRITDQLLLLMRKVFPGLDERMPTTKFKRL